MIGFMTVNRFCIGIDVLHWDWSVSRHGSDYLFNPNRYFFET